MRNASAIVFVALSAARAAWISCSNNSERSRIDRDVCIGCGRCYVSCRDGGHQAIAFGEDRKPRFLGAKCVGCHLCRLICPTGAIGVSKRVAKSNRCK
jgi:MinD superfamily P-loop ATPase